MSSRFHPSLPRPRLLVGRLHYYPSRGTDPFPSSAYPFPFSYSPATVLNSIDVSQLGTTIGAALDFVEVHYGFGKHQQFLSPHSLREFRKYTFGEWIQTFATLMFTKVSICLFLIRIPQSKSLKRPLEWAVAFLLFSNTILTVLWVMQCQPLHAAWDDEGICLSKGAKEGIVLTQAVISVVSDFSFAVLPGFFLWRTQIDFRTKIGLWVLMGLGFITGIFCLVRTVINNQSLPVDQSYGGIVNWVWRLFEVQIGIIAACIPTLRPLWTWSVRKMKGKSDQLDPHIKFPLSDKGSVWTDDTKEARRPRDWRRTSGRDLRQDSSATSNQQKVDPRRDTLGEELIREGIIDAQHQHSPTSSAAIPKQENDTTLRKEMHKYGINDSLV